MFNLYHIDFAYLEYLRQYEEKVPLVYGRKGKRPFLGVVIKMNHKNYFAPLSSPKEKHKTMKDNKDFLKIKAGELGVINFNNMIPIPISRCTKMEIGEVRDEKYRILLLHQIFWCNCHEIEIIEKAKALYESIYYSGGSESLFLESRCCNFKLLEEKCRDYMRVNTVNETEFEYHYA